MPARDQAPIGAPCWVDLTTSDTESSREFYSELFGWTAEEPAEEFGGYFMFSKAGAPVGGCMSAMPGAPISDIWSIYLASDDAHKTVAAASANGGQVHLPPMDVADLGTMAVVADAGGAAIGVWQPGSFQGSAILAEPGAPGWFELQTRDFDAAVNFYRDVFHWDAHVMSDSPEFRYTTLGEGRDALAGIMDASGFLPDGVPAHWSVYFAVEDTDASLAKVAELGGAVLAEAETTPYGRLGTAADPNGARFKLVAGS